LINQVSAFTGNADVLLLDELIFPGFIDIHVHAREDQSHSQEYKEDFKTAGEAAVNGGVVMFAEMPNNPVPPVDDETASRWRKMKLYGGRGKTAGEKRFGTFDVKDQASEAFGGEIQAVKNLLSSIFGGEG